jgi:cobalt-zinc-cadmium efflux system outer membrane protein
MKWKSSILPLLIFTVTMLKVNVSTGTDFWFAPFDSDATESVSDDTILTLQDALRLVAQKNTAFRSFDHQLKAARGYLRQAGIWSNPEIGAEFEEVGWDAPGFRESEFTLSVSQEFEFFGQRGARNGVATAQLNETATQIRLSAFDLYLEAKSRFYSLSHAQQKEELSRKSVDLASKIVENIKYRLDKGAALHSELLLAQLEEQRALLALEQAKQDKAAKEALLTALWMTNSSGIKVSVNGEPDHEYLLAKIDVLQDKIDSSRQILLTRNELNILEAEKKLVNAESRPAITLSGGVKRFEVDKSRSFLFGISLPIPLFNRNQGMLQSIDSRIRSLEIYAEQQRVETAAGIRSQSIQLKKLIDGHATIDSILLPTSEKAYQTLQNAYEAGRVPYVQLLEAERALNDLNFEHNDMLLAIQEQVIELESLTGVILSAEKEK